MFLMFRDFLVPLALINVYLQCFEYAVRVWYKFLQYSPNPCASAIKLETLQSMLRTLIPTRLQNRAIDIV